MSIKALALPNHELMLTARVSFNNRMLPHSAVWK